MLIAFGVILHFVLTIVSPRGLLADEIASFCALGEVLHLLRCGKSGSDCSRELAEAIQRHAAAFLKAYPSAEVKPHKPLRPSRAIALGARWLHHGRVYWGAQSPTHKDAGGEYNQHSELREERLAARLSTSMYNYVRGCFC